MKLKGLFLLLLLVGIGSTSCKKKCVIDKEDTDSGAIVSETTSGETVVLYYPGYAGANVPNHFSSSNSNIEVSFDGGQTKGPVNYSQYHVLRNPVTVTCEAKVDREVIFNTTAQTVTYNIDVTNCTDCDDKYVAENYVLVPAIPSSYTVVYNVNITEVD